MSAFGNKLNELMERKDVNGQGLAAAIGKSQAHVSALRTGKQKWVSAEDLKSIGLALHASKKEKAELLYAHLLDECEGEGSEWIEINLRGYTPPDPLDITNVMRLRGSTPQKLLDSLDRVHRIALEDPDMADVIHGLARLTGHGDPSEPSNLSDLIRYPESARPGIMNEQPSEPPKKKKTIADGSVARRQ